tara:strand:- start:79 stop:423 length:345 start_codon:yes stop_codon:yes gene_type:complete
MDDEKEESLTPEVKSDRNGVLREYANFSFTAALDEVNNKLDEEKNYSKKLGLMAAKSWILRNEIYAAINDPYISALVEVENTDIFDGLEDEDYNEFDSLFDDDTNSTSDNKEQS